MESSTNNADLFRSPSTGTLDVDASATRDAVALAARVRRYSTNLALSPAIAALSPTFCNGYTGLAIAAFLIAGLLVIVVHTAPQSGQTPSPGPPSPGPPGHCYTATLGEPCYSDVWWAREQGIYSSPQNYEGLTPTSSFEEFQAFLHNSGTTHCQLPCPPGSASGAACTADMQDRVMTKGVAKGLVLDDTSFHWCSAAVLPYIWPNTKQPVQSIRTFHTWELDWNSASLPAAAANFVRHVRRYNVKVLLGTSISCNESDDLLDWRRTLNLASEIGVDNIMGLAVGNEVDLLHTKDYAKKSPGCIHNMWDGGYYWKATQLRVAEMDSLGGGFENVPVTVVMSGGALSGNPFKDTGQARMNTFLQNAFRTYGDRWAFTVNFYSYWNAGALPPCASAIKSATCWDSHDNACMMTSSFKSARRKIQQLTGKSDSTFWVGETGWSSPVTSNPPSLAARTCSDFGSHRTLATFYDNFLSFDMELPGMKGPDHIFYFALRDSEQFERQEHFGLWKQGSDMSTQCLVAECKLQAVDFGLSPPPSPAPRPSPPPSPVPPPSPPSPTGKCCWSKWGDVSTCGNYPTGGSGGLCNQDFTSKCTGDGNCNGA